MMAASKNNAKKFEDRTMFYDAMNKPITGIRVCIINDSHVVQEGLIAAIENRPNIRQIIAVTKSKYLEKYSSEKFDVIISEIEFDDGINPLFVKELRTNSKNSVIIVNTGLQNYYHRITSLSNGADYFIFLRDISLMLGHIVGTVARNKRYSVMVKK